AKSATMLATKASNEVSQPNSLAYSSPCAMITQPMSPGRSAARIRTPTALTAAPNIAHLQSETVVSVRGYDASVPTATSTPSPRRTELLEAAYAYVLEHGLADISLRPLASAIGSSPRVLLYLFRSKDGLVRALLARARADELEGIARLRQPDVGVGLRERLTEVWSWLEAPGHRALLRLWAEAHARSLL